MGELKFHPGEVEVKRSKEVFPVAGGSGAVAAAVGEGGPIPFAALVVHETASPVDHAEAVGVDDGVLGCGALRANQQARFDLVLGRGQESDHRALAREGEGGKAPVPLLLNSGRCGRRRGPSQFLPQTWSPCGGL
jgi:hypothetical protein